MVAVTAMDGIAQRDSHGLRARRGNVVRHWPDNALIKNACRLGVFEFGTTAVSPDNCPAAMR